MTLEIDKPLSPINLNPVKAGKEAVRAAAEEVYAVAKAKRAEAMKLFHDCLAAIHEGDRLFGLVFRAANKLALFEKEGELNGDQVGRDSPERV